MHSGAFSKFVGRLDVDVTDDPTAINAYYGDPNHYDSANGFEVIAGNMQIFPIDNTVPQAADIVQLLEPYQQALTTMGKLDQYVGYAPALLKRTAPSGGDSQLGNLIATSMWLRLGVQTDFSMTNTTGIRADVPAGPVKFADMYNVFPFNNAISKMTLSGQEVLEMFDFAARRSASRACTSQVQIAGAFLVMNCSGCDVTHYRTDLIDPTTACAEQVFIGYQNSMPCKLDSDCSADSYLQRNMCDTNVGLCRLPVSALGGAFELATSDYLAAGGSGFDVLRRNTTQINTRIQQRDAVDDFVRFGNPCGFQKPTTNNGTPGSLLSCATDTDCQTVGAGYVCACPEASAVADNAGSLTCSTNGQCGSTGKCVLATCRDDVANAQAIDQCPTDGNLRANCVAQACQQGGEECKYLACIDANIGAQVDGRVVVEGR
jgi:5'-nucleotidase